jgi:hypothetical protein
MIGTKKWKICLVPVGECSVSRHSSVKFDFPPNLSEEEVVVFINAPNPNGAPPAMFSSPCLPASALSVPIDDWRDELLEVKDWQSWLNAMSSSAVRDGDTVKMDLAKKKFDQLPPVKTPLKKLRYLLPTSPRDDDWEGVYPTPDELPAGGSPNAIMDALQVGWPIMVQNVEDTASRLTDTRTNLRQFQSSMSDDMTMWDFQLQDLTVFLGHRPVAFGTSSVWEALQDSSVETEQTSLAVTSVIKTVSELTTQMGSFRSPDGLFRDMVFQRKLTEIVQQATKLALDPVKQVLLNFSAFYWKYTATMTSGASIPVGGDLLEARLQRLESLSAKPTPLGVSWEAAVNGQSAGPMHTWNNPGIVNQGGSGSIFSSPPPPAAVPDYLLQEMAQMKLHLDGLRSEMHSDRVPCGGVLFTSQQFATNWVVKHGIEDKMELFLDLVSLSSLSFHSLGTDMDELRFDEYATKRSDKGSTNEAIYELSFRKELPAVFGATPQNGVARNSRTLPALPSFADWDPQLGMNGARHVMAHNIRQTVPVLRQMMQILPPEAQAVALELINDADRCHVALASHMTNHYIELRNTSASNESEIWMLVSAGVREFFRHLAEKRFQAKRLSPLLTPERRAGAYLWATLQANSLMKEWMAADFKNHPRIAPMLTLHLFEFRVPRSEHKALLARVKALEA